MIQVTPFPVNPFAENTYLLSDETNNAIIIDCGCLEPYENERLQTTVAARGLSLKEEINTHMHPDHCCGNAFLQRTYGIGFACHAAERMFAEHAQDYAVQLGLRIEEQPLPTRFLQDGDSIFFGNSVLRVLETPGHSPGGLCFYAEQDGLLFSGDTLFCLGIGRSDLWQGDEAQLRSSVRNVLFALPDSTTVYPGHGEQTSIGFERKNNPFL